MEKTALAALLALASALCVAIADVTQQRATHLAAATAANNRQLFGALFADRRWRWGALILLGSIVLQAEALDQGSVLLVQALLVLSLLFALPISARLTNRAVTAREWTWAAVLTVAVTLIVTVGNPQPGHSRASSQAWLEVVATLGPLLVGSLIAARILSGALPAVLLAFVSGSLWGVFAVLTKGAMFVLHDGIGAAITAPECYFWLLTAIGGFAFEQIAFRAGALTASMPTLEVTQPVIGALLGVVVLGETLNSSAPAVAVLAVAAVVMTIATVELARGNAVATHGRGQHPSGGARADTAGHAESQPRSNGTSPPGPATGRS